MENKRITDIVFFIIFLNIFFSIIGFYKNRTSPPILFGAILILILTLYFYFQGRKVRLVSYKEFIPFWIIGFSYLIFGCIYLVPTYLVYGFIFIFQLPLFYNYISTIENRYLILVFSKNAVFFFIIAVIFAFILAPITNGQYCGILDNPNHWGEWVVFTMIPTLYLYENVVSIKLKIVLMVLVGIETANIIFSASRTTVLAYMAIIVVFVYYKIVNNKISFKRMLVAILIIILTFSSSYLLLKHITPQTASYFWGYNIDEESENVNLEEVITNVEDRYTKGIKDERSISSGRIEIWQTYISAISIKGHDPEPLKIISRSYTSGQNAHNAFLQVGYEAGMIAGFAFIFVNLKMMWIVVRQILSKKIDSIDFFIISGLFVAFVYMLLSSEFAPYNSFAMMAFWIFTIPNLIQKEKGKNESKNINDW